MDMPDIDAGDDPQRPDISVVLPVFNEREHLLDELTRIRRGLDASSYTYELIVVDDGSTDGSLELLRGLDDIRLIAFPTNRGAGSARRAGTMAARGDVVVWTDVDMTYPNDRMAELVDQLDGWDQIVGARTSEEGTVKALRVPAKWAIRRLASYLVETQIPDLNSGFRAFRREIGQQYAHLLPPGFSCVTTLTLSFLANGHSVGYVPIDYDKRSGKSKFHWWADTRRYATQVIRMVLSYNPLKVFLPVGLWLFVAGIAKLAYDWASRDFALAANTLLLFLAAFNVISIGLLADLVVRLNAHPPPARTSDARPTASAVPRDRRSA
jgi:polyisoprenyl-phosphate glycosyltransferase